MLPLAFDVLPVLMAVGFPAAVAASSGLRAGLVAVTGAAAWLGITRGLAQRGFFAHFDPPRVPLLLVAMAALLIWIARSRYGRSLAGLPLALIVGAQSFRIVVELGIHRAAMDGVAPVEMSWSGWNFDVVTGITALLLAPVAGRVPRGLLAAWNVVGIALLATVVGTAMLAMPTPFQQIRTDPPNTWVATGSYIWLPAVHVPRGVCATDRESGGAPRGPDRGVAPSTQ